LVVPEATFIADANQGCGPDVRIADRAFAITFVAEATYSNARLLSAHNEIAANCQDMLLGAGRLPWKTEVGQGGGDLRMMARHGRVCGCVKSSKHNFEEILQLSESFSCSFEGCRWKKFLLQRR